MSPFFNLFINKPQKSVARYAQTAVTIELEYYNLLVEKVSILFIGRKSVPFYLLVEKVSTLLLVDNMSVDNMSVENMSVEKTSRCRQAGRSNKQSIYLDVYDKMSQIEAVYVLYVSVWKRSSLKRSSLDWLIQICIRS